MRQELFAYCVSDYVPKVLRFTRHFSREAAEKHYGDVGKKYRGNPQTDYWVTVLTRQEMTDTFPESDGYVIDWKAKTITKENK